MKKDIPSYKVKDVAIAIAPESGDPNAEVWDVYLINLKDEMLENVLVNSRGYGQVKGETVETTTLRYFFDNVASKAFVKVEILKKELVGLVNEYWISFRLNNYMYDRKYIFVNGSLDETNFTRIPVLGKRGVMIK